MCIDDTEECPDSKIINIEVLIHARTTPWHCGHRAWAELGRILRTHRLILEGLLSRSTEVYEHGNAKTIGYNGRRSL
jgi:hypothetical protein